MEKKQSSEKKAKLHPRNKHRGRYDFELLTKANPELLSYVFTNKYGDTSINFFDNKAVLALNKALLKQYYHIEYWEIPNNYLCPPIPGRADYIHYIADLINSGKMEPGKNTRCLDIGVGANCIYPIIGVQEYDWAFVGSDIDTSALTSAHKIVLSNSSLAKKVELRHQSNTDHILKGIIKPNDNFDITICNPPFHASAQDAKRGTLRKLSNLKGKKISKAQLNFGGKNNELWCEGGEKAFVCRLITESKSFANSCRWFSSLVSKESNLPAIYRTLKRVEAKQVKTIQMGQGNKISRIVAWRFQ